MSQDQTLSSLSGHASYWVRKGETFWDWADLTNPIG